MSNAKDSRTRHWPAWLWSALVLALLCQQVGFWRQSRLDSDVMALLPGERHDAMLTAANRQIEESATQQIVVLVGSHDFERAKSAAGSFLKAIPSALLKSVKSDEGADAALDFYRPHRAAMLTSAQRKRLADADPNQLADAVLAHLYGPGIAGGLTDWKADPLALWPEWWQARLGQGIQSRDGFVSVSRDGVEWIVLRFVTDASTFRLDGNGRVHAAFAIASAHARAADPDVKILEAGVPLHAEAAAVRANWEINTIGFGSLLAVIVLVWLAFRSLRPILLVSLSLLLGTLAGVAATAIVFGKVHVLTLVFGASLVGVAEDYGIHYFASRQGDPVTPARTLMRHLMPGMLLALATSVLAYLTLGLAPLPGLQQMAVFSAAGLIAAFLTVVCWFPALDRNAPRSSAFARRVAASLARWPRWRLRGRTGIVLSLVATVIIAGGLFRLHPHDDLRSLQNSQPALLQQEREVGGLLGLPSPAQFYLVSGANSDDVLRREEQLTQRLDAVVADGGIAGYRAVSDWAPSTERQHADTQLTARVETAVLARVSSAIGEAITPAPTASAPLRLDAWLQSPASTPLRNLWLGTIDGQQGSLVLLQGLGAKADLQRMQALTAGLPGVRWINRTREISDLLGRYRRMMSMMLVAGYLLVAIALAWRFKREAWRALLPTALSGLLSLALLGWLGEPLQLFTVLAQFLLLGMGVDYGIFLVEHHDDPASWLAVSLGAASTVLSFGLLALSATPALHTFGLTMLFGVSLAWLLAPCFRSATRRADAMSSQSLNGTIAHAD
ncbi:MAG: MMPL family transporter [Lysobacteraceae bacterium]